MQANNAPLFTAILPQEQDIPFFPETTQRILLSETTTIEQLPACHYQVPDDVLVQQVEKMLRASPGLPGVMLSRSSAIVGVISRRRFFEILGTRYGVAVFLKRPIGIMAAHVTEPLMLPGSCRIDEAVRKALERENVLVYEPILVNCETNGFQLLDIYALLLAQSQLFASLQKELQVVNADLENRVARRTEQLTAVNAQLNQEVTERKQAQAYLQVRVRYEQAVARAADSLLAAVDDPEIIPETLRRMLKATRVSRVYLHEYVVEDGQPGLRLLHEVRALGAPPVQESCQFFPYADYRDWIEMLWTGKVLISDAQATTGPARRLLEQLGVQSFLILPVGKVGDWYGIIGLDETAVVREWNRDDIQLLQTIARMLFAYIERQRSREVITRAKDEAVKANQFKTELMAKVNHELRTPMGAILGYTQLLQYGHYGPLAAEQQDPLRLIISSTNYLSTLVGSLLDQAQLEKGALILESQPFPLNEMILEVDARIRILAEKTGLEFHINVEPGFPEELVGDRTRLQQIWTNLLSNAIKFTEEGHVQTWIRRHGSDQWVIEVTDTGSGIPKEAQPHIFEAFVQVDGSPTRRRSGAGLGLSVAASIVELMGGQILLQSEVGQGTTFTVYLPLHMNNKVDGR